MATDLDATAKTVGDVLRRLVPGKETVFDVKEMVDDDGAFQRVSIGIRNLEPIINQASVDRAKARNHVFHSVNAFTQYLMREGDESTLVLADVAASKITAVLSEDSEIDREQIHFLAMLHPLFIRWKALLGRAIPVLEFALFVMKFRSAVLQPKGRELALLFTQIKASKNVTKRVGIGNKSLNGVTVELQIGSEKNSVEVDLPETIRIATPIYLDTDSIEIDLDILVTEQNDQLVVFLTAPAIEELMYKTFQSMVDTIGEKTEFCVGLGQVSQRAWELIR